MATSAKQDRNFIEAMIASSLLEQAIEWIASNMGPEDVFTHGQLQAWAESNGFVHGDGGE